MNLNLKSFTGKNKNKLIIKFQISSKLILRSIPMPAAIAKSVE